MIAVAVVAMLLGAIAWIRQRRETFIRRSWACLERSMKYQQSALDLLMVKQGYHPPFTPIDTYRIDQKI